MAFWNRSGRAESQASAPLSDTPPAPAAREPLSSDWASAFHDTHDGEERDPFELEWASASSVNEDGAEREAGEDPPPLPLFAPVSPRAYIPEWLPIALAEMGSEGIGGVTRAARFVEYGETLPKTPTLDETQSASAFVAWCVARSGHRIPEGVTREARSWLDAKSVVHLGAPKLGCIAVFWEAGPHGRAAHVCFVLSRQEEHGLITCLGVNARNVVSVRHESESRLLGYVWVPLSLATLPPVTSAGAQ